MKEKWSNRTRGLRKIRWGIVTLMITCCCGIWLLIISGNMFWLQEKTIAKGPDFRGLPANDVSTLIDLKDFRFTINHLLCNGSEANFVVLIASAPENIAKRSVIRETWGAPAFRVVHLFFVGLSIQHQIQILKEDEQYSDIIQANFQDTYTNLTYKHAMILKWVSYYCPSIQYIVKVDDDIFVNISAMVKYLKRDLIPRSDFYCNVVYNGHVLRNKISKWYVAPHEYSGKKYPVYCLGHALIYSPNVVFQLNRQIQKEPLFWIEDVHVTGTLAKQLNLTHSSLPPALSLTIKSMHKLFANPNNKAADFRFGPAHTNEHDIRAIFNFTRSKNQPELQVVEN